MAHRIATVVALLLVLGGQARAFESDEQVQEAKEEGESALSGTVILENSVGLGTFIENPDTGKMKMPYHAILLTGRLAWAFTETLSLRARFDLEKELTSSYATSTTRRHQIMPGDIMLSLLDARLWKDEWLTGISFSGDLRVYLPTSYASRYASRILGTGVRLGASREFGGFRFGVGTRYTYYFNRYDHPVVPDYEDHPDQVPCSGLDVDGGLVCGGMSNTEYSLTHDFQIGYDLTDHFSLTAMLYVINRFSYGHEPDELSSPLATGENQRDLTWGVVDLSYQVNRQLGYSVGVSSFQPAKTEDGERLRFPFWDVEGRAQNYVTFYMDIQGSF